MNRTSQPAFGTFILRFILLFLALSAIPILAMVIFLRQAVHTEFVRNMATDQHGLLTDTIQRSMASEMSAAEMLGLLPVQSGQIAFILQGDGTYAAHSDSSKASQLARDDYGSRTVNNILLQRDGVYVDPEGQYAFAFAPTGNQDTVLVLVMDASAIVSRLSDFETSGGLQLAVGIVFIAAASGMAVWLGIGASVPVFATTRSSNDPEPSDMRSKSDDMVDELGMLASAFNNMASHASQRIRTGPLDVEIREEMIDELDVLSSAFNNMASRARNLVMDLQQRVASRTQALEIAARVSREVTTVLDIDALLPELTKLTREGFNLHHVAIFLYDEERKVLHQAASASDDHHHQPPTRTEFLLEPPIGVIATAAHRQQVVLIEDVHNSPDFAPAGLLPDVKSEVALPMIMGGNLIGVLDLQSAHANSFTAPDIEIFTSLAEQIAIAVRNAYLFQAEERARADAEASRKQAERADQVKSQFLASMSHELRTPLNAILSFNKLIVMGAFGEVNEAQKEYLEKSMDSGRHLLSLINDVLDISKIQSGQMKLFIEHDFNVAQEFESVATTAEKLLNEKPVKLVKEIDHDLPLLTCDKRRIRQVMLNLVSNAAKFTSEGVITLSAKREGDQVLLVVTDTGPGISSDQQQSIFEPFMQTEVGIMHGSGTGLGLPISRSIMEAHGGCLYVESAVGQGAEFYASLPLSLPPSLMEAEKAS